jgi:hypothetical protein
MNRRLLQLLSVRGIPPVLAIFRPNGPVVSCDPELSLAPAAGRPVTVAELDRMPYDGRRYELLDGVLIVSPRPTTVF